jgi:peroxiredoxin Q/BCP
MLSAVLLLAFGADAPAEPLKVGDKAPNITLPATLANKAVPGKKEQDTVSLKEIGANGKNVVLFFYPKAMTPGCTVESCGFTKISDQLAALDAVAIGISTDPVEDQQKFTEKEKLTTPLFADADKKTTKTYGVINPKNGRAKRVTFIIDKTGVIRKIYADVIPAKHPAEVLSYIKEHLK